MTGKERVIEVLRREGACLEGLEQLEKIPGNAIDRVSIDNLRWFVARFLPRAIDYHYNSPPFVRDDLAFWQGLCQGASTYATERRLRGVVHDYRDILVKWFDNYDLGDSSDSS